VTRAEWIAALAQARPHVVAMLAAVVATELAVEITRPPARGLLLATVREPVDNGLFHPGEILATTCEARIGDCLGSGIVLGTDDDRARGMAMVDAALQQEFPSRATVVARLGEERDVKRAADRAEAEMVRSTRVNFDTMEPQR
jgi:alpha-D-ribose 1-methylphosphonate 5-triphosphate synthase subunit PhnG